MADALPMKSTEKVAYTIGGFFADAAQTIPAKIDGQPIATIISGDGATVVEAADGMSGEVVSVDLADDAPARVATLQIQADANRDPAVKDFITVTQDFLINSPTGPVATNMGVTFGAPVPK